LADTASLFLIPVLPAAVSFMLPDAISFSGVTSLLLVSLILSILRSAGESNVLPLSKVGLAGAPSLATSTETFYSC
jgi:hypothetical protein